MDMGKRKHKVEVLMPEGILDHLDVKWLRKAFDDFWCWYRARYNMPASVDMVLVEGATDLTYKVVLTIKQDVSSDVLEDIRKKLEEIFKSYAPRA